MVRFQCPACGRKFTTKADLAGKKVKCSGCGAGVRVPAAAAGTEAAASSTATAPKRKLQTFGGDPNPSPPKAPAQVAPPKKRTIASAFIDEDDDGVAYGLAEDTDAGGGGSSPGKTEPAQLSSEQMLELARQKAIAAGKLSESTDPPIPGDKPRKKKKKKKKTGFFDPNETLKLVAGVGVFVAVIAGVAWGFPHFRFPLGGLLCIIGFIVYILGAISLRQLVAEEGMLKLLAYRFFPPYQWWFVLSRWSETKDYFAFFASGLLILSLGGGILKLSPQGQRAERAELAFQKAQGGSRDDDRAEADDQDTPPPVAKQANPRAGGPAPPGAAPAALPPGAGPAAAAPPSIPPREQAPAGQAQPRGRGRPMPGDD
jgi:hypothetical protein